MGHNPGMVQAVRNRVSGVPGALYPWRWWITLALCAALLFDLVVFKGHEVLWLLGWVIPVSFSLWFWGPIVSAWGRGARRAGKSFREGLDGQ
jgi:hypothetical protein